MRRDPPPARDVVDRHGVVEYGLYRLEHDNRGGTSEPWRVFGPPDARGDRECLDEHARYREACAKVRHLERERRRSASEPVRHDLAAALAALSERTEFAWSYQLDTPCRLWWNGADVRWRTYDDWCVQGEHAEATLSTSRPEEAWERLFTAGLIPESALADPQRLFETDFMDWYFDDGLNDRAHEQWEAAAPPEIRYDHLGGNPSAGLVTPPTVGMAVQLAADWANVLTAEALAREAVAYIAPAQVGAPICWCPVKRRAQREMLARVGERGSWQASNLCHAIAKLGYAFDRVEPDKRGRWTIRLAMEVETP